MIYKDIVIDFGQFKLRANCVATFSKAPRILQFSFSEGQDISQVLQKSGGNSEIIFTYNEEEKQWAFPTWLVHEDKILKSIKNFLTSNEIYNLPPMQ